MTVEQIEIYQNPEALARAAADRFTRVANAALKDAGFFTVALSGGNTPKALNLSVAQTRPGGKRVLRRECCLSLAFSRCGGG